jgi:hypothetical protein
MGFEDGVRAKARTYPTAVFLAACLTAKDNLAPKGWDGVGTSSAQFKIIKPPPLVEHH